MQSKRQYIDIISIFVLEFHDKTRQPRVRVFLSWHTRLYLPFTLILHNDPSLQELIHIEDYICNLVYAYHRQNRFIWNAFFIVTSITFFSIHRARLPNV